MKSYHAQFLVVPAFMILITSCNPTIIHPTATIAFALMATDTPSPTSMPSPTPTPMPPAETATFTPIPPLTVDYEMTYACNGDKAIYHITFHPSGGVPDYTFAPSETFFAKPGESKEAKVTSADGQTWRKYVPIIPNNCRQTSGGSSSGGGGSTSGGAVRGNDDPSPVVPECVPRGNSGKCKKK